MSPGGYYSKRQLNSTVGNTWMTVRLQVGVNAEVTNTVLERINLVTTHLGRRLTEVAIHDAWP